MAITNRDFAVGNKLVAKHSEKRFVIEAITGEGKRAVHWQVVEPEGWVSPLHGQEDRRSGGDTGRVFVSLGPVTDAITYPKLGPNQYVFFTRLEDEGAVEQTKAERTAAAAQAKADKEAKAAEAKTQKAADRDAKRNERKAAKEAAAANRVRGGSNGYKLIHHLEDGTWWCDGCMATIKDADGVAIVGDERPTDCNNGHIAKGVETFVNETSTPLETPEAGRKRRKAADAPVSEPKAKKVRTPKAEKPKTTRTRTPKVTDEVPEATEPTEAYSDGVTVEDEVTEQPEVV